MREREWPSTKDLPLESIVRTTTTGAITITEDLVTTFVPKV